MNEQMPVLADRTEKEKTREELLEEFKGSLEEHGVKDVEIEMEDNNLTIEQKYGEGIRGLSRSDSSVWMCLDQEDQESFKKNKGSNANTNVDFGKEYPGITFKESENGRMKIRIAANHPVATLANLLGKNKEVYLPGDFNKWYAPDPLEFNKETGEIEGEIEGKTIWDKNKPAQCKIAIRNKSEFDNGGWEDGAEQKMEIALEPEQEAEKEIGITAENVEGYDNKS